MNSFSRALIAFTALTVCSATAFAARQELAKPAPQLAELISAKALIYVDGPGLAEFLERGLEHPFIASLLASDIGQALLAEAETRPAELLAVSDAILGAPTFATLGALVSDGIALGVDQRFRLPIVTLVARSEDRGVWSTTLRNVLEWIAEEGDLGAEYARPQEQVHGADVWFPAPNVFLALHGTTAVASSSEGYLRDTLANLARAVPGLAGEDDWQSDAATRDGHELLWGWVDLAGVRAAARDSDPLSDLYALAEQPAVHMLLGTGAALTGRAARVSAALDVGADRIALELRGFELEPGPALELLPTADERTVVVPRPTPNEVARIVAYRDLGEVVARRAELFPAELLPAFSKAFNELAPILGGLDLGEDILPALSPWIRVVARDVEFAAGAVPDIRLPAAAVLVDLKEPEKLGPVLTSSFQTAIGLVNLQSAQEGGRSMLLGLTQCEEVTISAARFLAPDEGEGVDAVYNLEPACAQVGATFIVGSHRALVEELVGQLARGDTETLHDAGDFAVLRARPVADALQANFDALVMNSVLTEGKSLEVARGDIGGLIALTRLFERAVLRSDSAGASVVHELVLELADAERAR